MSIRAFTILAFATFVSPAWASTWPASIFDGASPGVLAVVKAHPDLVIDAERHIYQCTNPLDRDNCAFNQYRFVLDYIAAFYNDHDSQRDIEYDFSETASTSPGAWPDSRASTPGVVPNPLQSCAWSLAILFSGGSGVEPTDTYEVDINCKSLSGDARDAAKVRALFINRQIAAHIAAGNNPSSVVDAN